jgi:hypothetical protein
MPSDATNPSPAAAPARGVANSGQIDEGYPDDPMRVERGSTPDGRLLLYFTFPRSSDEPEVAADVPPASQQDQQERGQ